jgi:hypothetical protein
MAEKGAAEDQVISAESSDESTGSASAKRRTRTSRPFPASTFEDALVIGLAIQEHSAGRQIRRLTLFDALGRVPDSGASRQLVTNSGKYGITTGSYAADYLDLTDLGRVATSSDVSEAERTKARFELAIMYIPIFAALYENFKNNKLPALSVLGDFVRDQGVPESQVQECVDTFVVNCKFVGVLRSYAGAERFLSVEHVLDELHGGSSARDGRGVVMTETEGATPELAGAQSSGAVVITSMTSFDSTCFYISPIGDEGSEQRKHADLVMSTFVEPVLAQFDLNLIRADRISEAGMINSQMIEHIARSKLVVADLSYNNPNVFYEVALRHAVRKPIVQLIRRADRIPFDVQPFRTVIIDMSDIFTLVPQIEVYKSEIASQVRKSLDATGQAENPLSIFYPAFWTHMEC